jgi:hypothetical protein
MAGDIGKVIDAPVSTSAVPNNAFQQLFASGGSKGTGSPVSGGYSPIGINNYKPVGVGASGALATTPYVAAEPAGNDVGAPLGGGGTFTSNSNSYTGGALNAMIGQDPSNVSVSDGIGVSIDGGYGSQVGNAPRGDN